MREYQELPIACLWRGFRAGIPVWLRNLVLLLGVAAFEVNLVACGVLANKPAKQNPTLPDSNPDNTDYQSSGPNDFASSLQQADTLRKLGKLDDALYYYAKSLEFEPANTHSLVSIGNIHLGKAHYDLAEMAYRMALQASPRDADALEGLGLVQLRKRDYKGAEKSLAAAIATDPRRGEAHNGLGLVADQASQYNVAMNHYQQALRWQPKNPRFLTNLGYSKYLAKDWTSALNYFDSALKLDSTYEPAWLNKGLVLARQGQEKAALEAFREVLDEADAYNNLGYIYMMQGDVAGAEAWLQKSIDISPTYHQLANENIRRLRSR